MKKAAVIGLDGVAWHLLDPMIEKGVMPRLGALKERGAWGTLASTVPTYTPPAWTSAITGVNPGRHGIYGFVRGNAQWERQELAHAGAVKAPTIWEMCNAQGVRAGIYNVPLTYPPQPLDGWMVSGMMTPGYGDRLKGFVYPSELEERVLSWTPDYLVNVDADWEQDYKDSSLCDRMIHSLNQRLEVLGHLLEDGDTPVVFCVLEAPDRLQHVYYGYMDPAHPLYDSPAASEIRPRVHDCFAAMDRIVGLLDDYAGSDGGVVVCSDHGFTAWELSVHTNALLEQWGYLKLKSAARAMQTSAARKLVPLAKKVLPAKTARAAKGKTFGAIDWANTQAFASPIPQQGIFINLEGRERLGCVPAGRLEELKDEITARLTELKGPDGAPVTDVVHRAEDVFHGNALEGAPDLMPVLRNHRFELDDEIFHKDPFTDVTHLPRGVHHPDGVVIVAGPEIAPGTVDGRVWDVSPTLLYLAGLGVPDGLDGDVLTGAISPDRLRDRPVQTMPALSSTARDESSPYSEEEEAAIEESLRGLGYL